MQERQPVLTERYLVDVNLKSFAISTLLRDNRYARILINDRRLIKEKSGIEEH